MDDSPDFEWRLLRQQIADHRPGWTMDYIDTLSWRDVADLVDYIKGKTKAQEANK